MTFSTRSTPAMMAMLLFVTFCSQLATAQNSDTTTVSFTSVIYPAVPTIYVNMPFKGCAQIPEQVTAFVAQNTKAVFAIYQDDACKNYLYSVTGSMANMKGVKSMTFDKVDSSDAYQLGVTFVDSSVPPTAQPANRNILIAMVASGAVLFFAIASFGLWFMERKKKAKSSNKVGVTGAGLPVYASKSQEATARHVSASYPASAASSVSYLPAYNITTTTTTYTSD
ncbi:hypothetical protein BGZ96_007024 [Linnemannia gamsii]|uniref:Uncharacterized protein n=1 Tax=Linnemannia gamsii TaxID=64522 RepID=A0ABQ7KF09_9FUNG|nr:hypothetical protein BGZ96_007024 [Linnemannia gamsii]